MPEWGRGSTRASRSLRAKTLTLHPYCYLRYPGCTITATEDDHVIPLSQGGTDDPANHNGACHNCHATKSRREATHTRNTNLRTARHPRERHPGTD